MSMKDTTNATGSGNQPVLLRMEGICKSFPGVKALDNVSLTVRAGTVHALMGENGAGKSTLMKCLFGVYNKDAIFTWTARRSALRLPRKLWRTEWQWCTRS